MALKERVGNGKTDELPGFRTAAQIMQGDEPPKIIQLHKQNSIAEKSVLENAFRYLEEHRLCDPATKLTARAYHLAYNKTLSDTAQKVEKDLVHAGQIYHETDEFTRNKIEKELRELVQYELSRDQVELIPACCERLAQETKVGAIEAKAKKLAERYISERDTIIGEHDPSNIASSEISTSDLFKLLRAFFDAASDFERLNEISDYAAGKDPKFEDGDAKLDRAKIIVGFVAENKAPLGEKILALSEHLGVSEDTVKKTLREIAYAAFNGARDLAEEQMKAFGIGPGEVFELDLRKTPHSLNEGIRKFNFAIQTGQLSEDNCRAAAMELLKFPQQENKDELINSYLPLSHSEVSKTAERIIEYMTKTVDIKAESMKAHPVRKASWFRLRMGRITKWETDEIGKAPPEQLEGLKRAQLHYDFLYEQSMVQFAFQVAELRAFIDHYGTGLQPEFRRMVVELIGKDPLNGKNVAGEPERLGAYLKSLEKTLNRWNELSKEFRKAPYSLERALGTRYGDAKGSGTEEILLTAVEADLLEKMSKLRNGYDNELELLAGIRQARLDIEQRLASIAQHGKAAKKVYALAMDVREKKLGDALPTRKRKKRE